MNTANRKYKDSVFVDLFSEDEKAKENFLSLYNALHGTELKDTAQLKNIRLDQVLYMSFYNDVSYLVDNKIIVLAEHQSTINPNMPLRCLEYVSRLYEALFESKEKYSRKLLNIPTPEFYVFYNGEETYPSNKTLRLSDAFIEKTEVSSLELTVKVININKQNGHPILENCKMMYEYTVFVETVRRWKKTDPQNSFQKAIEECIANNILRNYLTRKTKEVLNMLLAEYDYETDIAVQRAEERETAFAEGIEQGFEQGIEQGIERGIEQGFTKGSYQKALETAKNLTEMGFAVEAIAKATGLTIEEIEAL
ncbi:Rpn family recombination-promoting nuclease/putative transposase [Treponema sp. OMZ 787]|uniref:Rpn family recombination-promoting nuclease/putative transposase n=1 Tax=Treponema sp. OMZ 787 TaxID=2563669 RepID=UPI0020A36728|nr:Rpn family recombination-promoting nuclease/putative transposase [Treponema sp. OMZ 787]UTC62321.1 Rpn family recombination-promoting nuclease/putative transposase [Treponema sp. OMZ 787]